jgi:hypothetical protein
MVLCVTYLNMIQQFPWLDCNSLPMMFSTREQSILDPPPTPHVHLWRHKRGVISTAHESFEIKHGHSAIRLRRFSVQLEKVLRSY